MRYRDINKIFTSNNILIYIAMSMLSQDKNNILPELLYTLDRKDLLKMITVFGGEKIYIPTPAEFKFYMNSALCFYYKYSRKRPRAWEEVHLLLPLEDKEFEKVKKQVKAWSKVCSKEEKELLKNLNEEIIRL